MINMVFAFLLAVVLSTTNGAPACENTWMAYKDELCIKAFTNVETYENAKDYCSSVGEPASLASLVMIKDAEMQELLANYTEGFFDYVWLGGRYDINSSQFKWDNGQTLGYTNWMDGYPRNDTAVQAACIEMRPMENKDLAQGVNAHGKWAHEPCLKRNLVMCQKPLSWSFQDAVAEIINLRRHHEQELLQVREELTKVNTELATVTSRVIPIGSIYVEYYNQPTPGALWPSLTWQDITSTYAGLFFRALGGEAASWGSTQNACAPRLTQVGFADGSPGAPKLISLPENGWSEYVLAGYHVSNNHDEGDILRFNTQDCEVRPKNQAIRIWKRTA